jgi:hypothetical protein
MLESSSDIEITGGPHIFTVRVAGKTIGEVWSRREKTISSGNVWHCTGGFSSSRKNNLETPGTFQSQVDAINFLLKNPPEFPLVFEEIGRTISE